MRNKIAVFVVFVLGIIILAIIIFFSSMSQKKLVDYEFIGRVAKVDELYWDYWFVVNDNQNTEITSSELTKYCDLVDVDFMQYTYIVVDGHTLSQMYYKPIDNKGGLSKNRGYYGYATLEEADPNSFYFYRIPSRIRIVNDDHARFGENHRTTIIQTGN